ncbi:MAG: hypothetical protein RIS38_1047 [Verrucomicrobiota bacterium]
MPIAPPCSRMTRFTAHSRRGSALRKLLTLLCGVALFLVLAGVLGVWALGRFSPKLLDATLSARTGAHVAVEENDTNLLAGRIAYSGLTITNPSRWQERGCLQIKRLALEIDPLSFGAEGGRIVHQAELDLAQLTLVGKGDLFADNNALDILAGLKAGADPSATPSEGSARQAFLIKRLRIRLGRVTLIEGDGTPDRRVLLDEDLAFEMEAKDVTENNFQAKVTEVIVTQSLRNAVLANPRLLLRLSLRRVLAPASK